MNNIKKQAAKDAAEYARAYMFYGEGAGTRRKLIYETVAYKERVVPGYAEAFAKAYAKQDMAKHANKAASERMRKDVSKKVGRNVRGITKGNRKSLTTGIALAVVVGSWAHEEGYDVKALDYTKKQYRSLKNKVEVQRFKKKVDNVITITDVP